MPFVPGWDIPKLDTSLFTVHFGLVSDFLSEAWAHLRSDNRLHQLQGRVNYGGSIKWA